MKKLGAEAKFYIEGGTYETPTFTEVKCLQDVNVDAPDGEEDASSRRTLFNEFIPGRTDLSIPAKVLHDSADPNFVAIRAAKINRTVIKLLVMDGPVLTPGSLGIRGGFNVFGFQRGEPVNGIMAYDIVLRPSANAEHVPEWFAVST